MLSWQQHGTTRETPHKNIFNMAIIVMDDISSDSGIFFDSKVYYSYFGHNISFIEFSEGLRCLISSGILYTYLK